MREQGARRQSKKLDSDVRRLNWYSLPAVYWKYRYDTSSNLYIDDRDARTSTPVLSDKGFYNSIAITLCSATITGYGIGQLISELVRG